MKRSSTNHAAASPPTAFRSCVGSFPTGVTVVTVRHDEQVAGMTLNSFTSVSLSPLLVLVSLAHGTRTLDLVRRGERFAVSVLHREQEHVARAFATNGAAFAHDHVVDDGSHLVVADALATFKCSVADVVTAGDHDLVIGAVAAFEGGDGEPLVFHRGAFGQLATPRPLGSAAG